MRIDWISFDAILFWPERSRSAAFVPSLPTTLQKKKERKTARPCWFFPFTQLSFHPLLISAAHAVVPFNGHRQKVFNLMPATWSGNLSYEHSLHSQKTLFLSLSRVRYWTDLGQQKSWTDAAQIEKPRMPIFMLGTMRAINKKPRLRSWQKTQKPRKYVCVYLCAPVCVCESVYVRVTVCVQPAFGFEPFCCATTKNITSYIPTWCYPPLNKIQSTLSFYVK